MDFARNLEIQGNFVRFQIKVAGVWIWQLTHYRAHLDEVEAAFRLMKFGTREFLNKHCFRIGKEYLVRVGCMKGEFDEHRDHRGERKKDECADTLVAKALGCKADAALKYTKANDCDGKEQENGLASTLWMLERMFPHRQIEVINWGLTALKAKDMAAPDSDNFSVDEIAKYVAKKLPKHADAWCRLLAEGRAAQAVAFKAAVEQIKTEGKILVIPGPKGDKEKERKLRLLVIESDNPEIPRAGRFKDSGANADITLIRNSRGQVVISPNQRANMKLYNLARILRSEEKKLRGNAHFDKWWELSDEGPGQDGIWFFAHYGQFLMNGSLTAPATDPTRIKLDQIVEYIKIAVRPGTFEPSSAKACRLGICPHSTSPCPWYGWGLRWCQAIRKDVHQTDE